MTRCMNKLINYIIIIINYISLLLNYYPYKIILFSFTIFGFSFLFGWLFGFYSLKTEDVPPVIVSAPRFETPVERVDVHEKTIEYGVDTGAFSSAQPGDSRVVEEVLSPDSSPLPVPPWQKFAVSFNENDLPRL